MVSCMTCFSQAEVCFLTGSYTCMYICMYRVVTMLTNRWHKWVEFLTSANWSEVDLRTVFVPPGTFFMQ